MSCYKLSYKVLSVRIGISPSGLVNVLTHEVAEAFDSLPSGIPSSLGADTRSAFSLIGERRYKEAIEGLQTILKTWSDFAHIRLVLILAHLVIEDRESASREYIILNEQDEGLASKLTLLYGLSSYLE